MMPTMSTTAPSEAPLGIIHTFAFTGSAIFPGTGRTGAVFVPAQYDGSRPACVYVRQDGYLAAEKPILERLIADGEMPVTIGVFGDSFGDGVWAALYRRLAKDNVKVLRLSQEGTGFTRYQVVNLETKAAEQLKADPVDIAVIVTGANDTTCDSSAEVLAR